MGKLRIVARSDAPFSDRQEAGQLLGEELGSWRGREAVVLGIPRGGLVVASELAQALNADLDMVLAHKLGAPNNPELAFGAIAEDGQVVLHEQLVVSLGITGTYLEQEKGRQLAEIARRARLIRQVRPKVPRKGRPVIITDDGVATGATLQAALWTLRQEEPQQLIVALPVASEDTLRRTAPDADKTICLRVPAFFVAVGQFYRSFAQVEDEEVLAILKAAEPKSSAARN
jgi:predicted phosphoribosyltransferase